MNTPQPDFLRPVRGPHQLAWAACATALVVLGLASVDALQAFDARDQAQALATQRTRPVVRARPAPDTPAQRAKQQALAQLQRPWPQALAALESVQVPGVSWLALDVGEQGTLQLEGLAPDAASALAAAEALRAAPIWRAVLLARMDAAPSGGQRFAFQALPTAGAW
jgi:Tfp pilus assembly protein PilN